MFILERDEEVFDVSVDDDGTVRVYMTEDNELTPFDYIPDMNGVYHAGNMSALIDFLAVCRRDLGTALINVSKNSSTIAGCCRSEDSTLADVYVGVSKIAYDSALKIIECFEDFRKKLREFVEATQTNESTKAAELGEKVDRLSEASNELDSITW